MISGKVWKFGDNINTDLMLPGTLAHANEDEQKRAVFSANRPGWAQEVRPGEVIVAGRNFGIGSSRPAARSLRNLGLGFVVAESINGLFFRNAVNFGLLAVECAGAHAAFHEGDVAELDTESWTLRGTGTGVELALKRIPPELLRLMQSGGIYPLLEREGLIAAGTYPSHRGPAL